jgi:hypothetical protein
MKKIILLSFVLLSACPAFSQGGWTKITTGPVTTFTSAGYYKGAAWVDINNDGLIDLFAMPHFLFLNDGAGSFTQLSTPNINPTPLQNPGGCSWGDINNDGYIDFITAQNPSEIYLNNGDSTFSNVTNSIPALNGFASWGCVLADINNDNKLDLLYAQAYGFHGSATPYPCKLFIQDTAAFSFSAITGYAFTDSLKPYTVPYFDDYDMDGDMDLFIATGPGGSPGPDYCYRNMKKELGIDTLYKMTTESWAAQLQDGQCYNAIDADNDGDLDICLTNYGGAPSRFYLNDGAGTYTALSTPFTNTAHRLSNCWGDYDNDGDLDVIIASDNTALSYYENTGSNNFVLVTSSINVLSGSSAVVNGDYDNDGDLDVFVHGNGNARSLWRNDTVAGNRHWINITLQGVISNRSAIGAFVKLKATINGNSVWQVRQVNAQNSFQSQNDLRVHFGLNDATTIDSILIFWPSGVKEFYSNIHSNQFLVFIEGYGTPLDVKKNDGQQVSINIFPNPVHTSVQVNLANNGRPFTLKMYDSRGLLLFSKSENSRHVEIPVSELKPGCYLILIGMNQSTWLRKIIVE